MNQLLQAAIECAQEDDKLRATARSAQTGVNLVREALNRLGIGPAEQAGILLHQLELELADVLTEAVNA